jgi:fructose-1-phosphate kinase PfkB-like protein
MGAGFSFSGISVTKASVVRIIEAIEAAFYRAPRVTLAGSITPSLTMSMYCSLITS